MKKRSGKSKKNDDIDDKINFTNKRFYTKLLEILKSSQDNKVIDTIALWIHDLKYQEGLRALMEKIKDPVTENHSSTLLYACSVFDCSDYINELIHIVLFRNFHSGLEALSLIKENCKFKFKSITEIEGYLKYIKKNENEIPVENKEIVKNLIDFLEKLKSQYDA